MKKNCSKEELIVTKSTVRFTIKQKQFSNRRKGELYMDRVLERKIKVFFQEKPCLFKGKWITGKNDCSKEYGFLYNEKNIWIIRKNVCCDEQGSL